MPTSVEVPEVAAPKEGWSVEAACLGMNPDLFHEPGRYPQAIVRVCQSCPVIESCLADAFKCERTLPRDAVVGYRAGMSGARRFELFRQVVG